MKKLFIVSTLLFLSSCATGPGWGELAKQKCVQYGKDTGAKLSKWVDCYDKEYRKIADANGGITEIDHLSLLKRKALAKKVDNGEMTEDEYDFEIQSHAYQLEQQERMQRAITPVPSFPVQQKCYTQRLGNQLMTQCH